ncbi:MAG: hypothetical protein N2559_13955 [Anaerolineae bacterium]|nr:hypothetical protein [Anaerolineae bacterium]
MSDSATQADRLHTLIAILIALLAVVGAVISWRVAVTSDQANRADGAGLRAMTDREDITLRAQIILTEHLTAYASYLENDALADAYKALARVNPGQTDLADYASVFRYAANQARDAIPQRYLDREERLMRERDLGANIAQEVRNKDVEPLPHFARADAYRQKIRLLLVTIFSLSFAAFLLTIADALHNPLRYLFLLGGATVFILATLAALSIEIASALGFLEQVRLEWLTLP